MFAAAQHAPSWCNVQPWRVAITEPPKTAALAEAMQAAAKSGLPRAEVAVPARLSRRRTSSTGSRAAPRSIRNMGIARDDKAGRYDAWLRNYAFFDAPHVAIVACDRRLGPYAYVDVGAVARLSS